MNLLYKLQDLLDATRAVDWLAPLALRLYLAPVFWVAGMNKLSGFDNIVQWFGEGLGLPFPYLMASLATGTEVIGAVLLVLGLAVRWISIPLMFTMVVAATTAHWNNGWQAVADPSSPFPPADVEGAIQRLSKARDLLKEHGNYEWLTENGSFIISNNGVEWAATYLLMLLPLVFIGGGRYVSLDYWIRKKYGRGEV
jgi:putative oxidoreductase